MSYVTVPLPQGFFRMRNGSFALQSFDTRASSRFAPGVPVYEGARDQLWSFEIQSVEMDRAQTIEMEAWFAQMADRNWCFSAYDPLRIYPLGVGNGAAIGNDEILFTDSAAADLSFCSDFKILEGSSTALVKTTAARGSKSVVVKGLDTALEGQAIVKKGDHIGIGQPGEMNLHMAVANAICDASGEARIEFVAPLWKRALPNDYVRFVMPTARFVMVDRNNQLVRSPGVFSQGSLRGIEVPYQEPQP